MRSSSPVRVAPPLAPVGEGTPQPPGPSTDVASLPSPTPTPVLDPGALLEEANRAAEDGDFTSAAAGYRALLDQPQQGDVDLLLALGTALLRDGQYSLAAGALEELASARTITQSASEAGFLLAEALVGAGEPLRAVEHYRAYISSGTAITGYVQEWVGDALRAGGEDDSALVAYEAALLDAPDVSTEVGLREKIALAHVAREDYAAALAEYDAILAVAQIPAYRARIEHQAAETELLAGQTEAAFARHERVVETYPTEESAHSSLVRLVEAGYPVDDYLRGVVDYRAGAYELAVVALTRYYLDDPITHLGDAHWYAGLSYLALDDSANAAREFSLLIDTHPGHERTADAWMKLADAHRAAGDTVAALVTYATLADVMPESPRAPEALWEAALLLERSGSLAAAAEAYADCQARYLSSGYAAGALFRAGLQSYRLGETVEAAVLLDTLAATYEDPYYRAAALFWLGRLRAGQGDQEAATLAFGEASTADPLGYYGLRAAQLVADLEAPPFPSSVLGPDHQADADHEEAEEWLAGWVGTDRAQVSGTLSPALADSPRLRRGIELWRLGRFAEGRAELEALRGETESDALTQYQLALLFRDIGLYRSSILCALRVVALSPASSILEAPPFVARLAYPHYYDHLVTQNAAEFGLDPLLVFAVVRQESLFESLATSTASAHGLMQVIPSTGAQIAATLGWPADYRTADLYRPFVSVRFGTFYLATQRDEFDGRVEVALAAYNGGPGNAARWLEGAEADADLFVELITFSETGQYVRRIREQLAVYQVLYGTWVTGWLGD